MWLKGGGERGQKFLLPGAAENIDPVLSASYDLPVLFISAAISYNVSLKTGFSQKYFKNKKKCR